MMLSMVNGLGLCRWFTVLAIDAAAAVVDDGDGSSGADTSDGSRCRRLGGGDIDNSLPATMANVSGGGGEST